MDEKTNTTAKEIIISPDLGVSIDTAEKAWVQAQRTAGGEFTIPVHYRERPKAVYVMFMRAANWRMDPLAVLDQTYVINGRIGYQSQLIHALIETRAGIQGRLRHDFMGEGPDLQCKVYARERETGDILSWTSPKISQIKIKNSQEWQNNPQKQLYYHTSRDWARVYFPEAILGLYTREELEAIPPGPENAKDVSINLVERLSGSIEGDGLQPEPRELKPEEPTIVQAEMVKRKGRPPGSRNKVSMKDIPNIEPIPEPSAEIEYATPEVEGPQ